MFAHLRSQYFLKRYLLLDGKIVLFNYLLQTPKTYATSRPKTKAINKLDALNDSLAQKGFLRPYKPYVPPADVAKQVRAICEQLKISFDVNAKFQNIKDKYIFLNHCSQTFKATIPNSYLTEIHNIGDVIRFFETPINTTVPFDLLTRLELPENLHIQHDYVRFDGDESIFFGQTAFPKSSTLVTGLKYRGKYKGYEAKRSWP